MDLTRTVVLPSKENKARKKQECVRGNDFNVTSRRHKAVKCGRTNGMHNPVQSVLYPKSELERQKVVNQGH